MAICVEESVTGKVIQHLLENKQQAVCNIGFDGYVDELYHVVKTRKSDDNIDFYDSIESFGKRILQAAHKSADLEMVLVQRKLGGNGPILSNALARMGAKVTCTGTLDVDGGDNPFLEMSANCRQLSFGHASHTIALEFDDGKVMLGNLRGSYITWDQLRERVGLSNLREAYRQSDLIAIVNWSGMRHIHEILRGYHREVCQHFPIEEQRRKLFFFDLADPTVLCEEGLDQLMENIQVFSQTAKVILGLNENEAIHLGRRCVSGPSSVSEIGEGLQAQLGLYQVIIHTNNRAFAFAKGETGSFQGMHVKHPVISTGAGDHFNAGYLWGILHGLNLEESLVLGQGEASYYLTTGQAPTKRELVHFLKTEMKTEKEL